MTSTDGIESIDEVVARLEKVLSALPEADANRHFLATYLRTTVAVGEAVSSGAFSDPEWVQRWDVAFAHLYLDAIEAYLDGSPTPAPWTVAFGTASERPEMAPLRHVLLGINAHINFDLPQALLAVMSDDDFAHPEVVAARQRDHDAIDDVLSSRVADEDAQLRQVTGPPAVVDRVLQPLNRLASKRFLREARDKVWANTLLLSTARRESPEALDRELRMLSSLAAAKLEHLVAPGQVLLKLGAGGFGVILPGAVGAPDKPSAPRSFDPVHVGTLERDAWVAYYRRRWGHLAVVSLRLMRAVFGLGPLDTLKASFYLVRSFKLWSPFPDNDPEGARINMERFYRLVGTTAPDLRADPAEVARLEIEWWRVHRCVQRYPDGLGYTDDDLAAAIADLYEYTYESPRARVTEAAEERTTAMRLSDRWVAEGCDPDSPLLEEEASSLVRSYAALLAAVHR